MCLALAIPSHTHTQGIHSLILTLNPDLSAKPLLVFLLLTLPLHAPRYAITCAAKFAAFEAMRASLIA